MRLLKHIVVGVVVPALWTTLAAEPAPRQEQTVRLFTGSRYRVAAREAVPQGVGLSEKGKRALSALLKKRTTLRLKHVRLQRAALESKRIELELFDGRGVVVGRNAKTRKPVHAKAAWCGATWHAKKNPKTYVMATLTLDSDGKRMYGFIRYIDDDIHRVYTLTPLGDGGDGHVLVEKDGRKLSGYCTMQ